MTKNDTSTKNLKTTSCWTRTSGRPLKTWIKGAKKEMIESRVMENMVFDMVEWKYKTQKGDDGCYYCSC